jgi:hypothetical protein
MLRQQRCNQRIEDLLPLAPAWARPIETPQAVMNLSDLAELRP